MTVSVSADPPYRLLVTSYGRTSEAGPRVLRGGIHPDISYSHDTREAAESDAHKLRTYFESLPGKPSKRALRAYGA